MDKSKGFQNLKSDKKFLSKRSKKSEGGFRTMKSKKFLDKTEKNTQIQINDNSNQLVNTRAETPKSGFRTMKSDKFKSKCRIPSKKDLKRIENVAKARKQTVEDVIIFDSLPNGWDTLSTDAEFIPACDMGTVPLCSSITDDASNKGEYLHVNNPYSDDEIEYIRECLDAIGEFKALKVSYAPNMILDYYKDTYGIEWRRNENSKRKYVHIINLIIFFSFKDIQYTFKSDTDYQFYVLTKLERIRRITSKFNKPIPLPYELYLPGKTGHWKWTSISLNIQDISAMQGTNGLKTYYQNVGIDSTDKGYEGKEKSRMDLRLLEDPVKFLKYIRCDTQLSRLKTKTVDFYNRIAELIGIEPREDWGMSTGKIAANMVSDWIANQAGIPVKDVYYNAECNDPEAAYNTDGIGELYKPALYQYTQLGNPESIKQLSHLNRLKNLLYLGMTDGGRCVKERVLIDGLYGVLVDIDIKSCYANGLLNQAFPIGNPKIIFNPMKYKDWEKKYAKKLSPGLWYGRISWKDAPFKQDLLISKEEKQFTSWDYYQQNFGEVVDDKEYDASMYLMTNTVHNAAYTHDQMQVIHKYSTPSELKWIRENAVIESFAFYANNEEIDTLDESLLMIESLDKFGKGGFKYRTKWKKVELKKLIEVLIERRTVHKNILKLYNESPLLCKGNTEVEINYNSINEVPSELVKLWETTGELEGRIAENHFSYIFGVKDKDFHSSTQKFIKLISNTIYGCIASIFFGGNGTGISNYVVGNNITARARTLAWCMAKGLHSLMSVTDGGVFDVNNVLSYKQTGLDIFANVSFEYFSNHRRHIVVEKIPLYGYEIPYNESMMSVLKDKSNHVEQKAWEHLSKIFSKLDIFAKNQFSFEVKNVYTKCILRNKSDYELTNEFIEDKPTIRIRGFRQDDDSQEQLNRMFRSIEHKSNNETIVQKSRRLLGLNEWKNRENLRKNLTPHDEIEVIKSFYALTPLGSRFLDSKHRMEILKEYNKARENNDSDAVARIKELETMRVWTSRPDGLKDNTSRRTKHKK